MGDSATVRAAELRAVSEFLGRVMDGPAGLVIEGESGIGKTTLWAAAARLAAESGIRVLSARASVAEAKLTFAVLADLLADVDGHVLDRLVAVQRLALNRVLLRGDEGPETDERVAAAGFLSVLELLAEQSPVLVAIDDLPWLDSSSRAVERRVAERAAAGMSNRDIAAALFLSPKTVEMNLSRVYRKLGIRSRAQLHTRLKLAESREDPGSVDGESG